MRVALDGSDLVGGIAYERYPASACGLLTYMVVAPGSRCRGLGRRLLDEAARALYAGGARAVFGEVNDPRVHGAAAWPRLERFVRWGARVVDIGYVQPSLGAGLLRDRGLRLVAFAGDAPLPRSLPGEVVRGFLRELYQVTERAPLDGELQALLDGIPERANLVEPQPPA